MTCQRASIEIGAAYNAYRSLANELDAFQITIVGPPDNPVVWRSMAKPKGHEALVRKMDEAWRNYLSLIEPYYEARKKHRDD